MNHIVAGSLYKPQRKHLYRSAKRRYELYFMILETPEQASSHPTAMSLSIPTDENKEDLLLACRYGDLEDIQQFIDTFGPDSLNDIRDDSGNTVLHMVCANGHTGVFAHKHSVSIFLKS